MYRTSCSDVVSLINRSSRPGTSPRSDLKTCCSCRSLLIKESIMNTIWGRVDELRSKQFRWFFIRIGHPCDTAHQQTMNVAKRVNCTSEMPSVTNQGVSARSRPKINERTKGGMLSRLTVSSAALNLAKRHRSEDVGLTQHQGSHQCCGPCRWGIHVC